MISVDDSFSISVCDLYFCIFFFFKQKTAYEMRISDWSSDVCSSDLDEKDAKTLRHCMADELDRFLTQVLPFLAIPLDQGGNVQAQNARFAEGGPKGRGIHRFRGQGEGRVRHHRDIGQAELLRQIIVGYPFQHHND